MQIRYQIINTILFGLFYEGQTATFSKISDDEPIVQTNYGCVRGYVERGTNERPYYAFKGIPYAKPPVGKLRFQAPQKPDKWTHILEAQTDPPACMQKNYLFGHKHAEGLEDCLYLNVYMPQVNNRSLLPVMVFIHWGGFFTGYSSSAYLGPDYLLERQDVVLVTFSYRLGVLGFLSTYNDTAPGNYGLKDQVAALQWVQDNIESFGGNKSKVTIFGQSAGGASVHYHLLSPQSRNLFHQAISQSGSALALWAKPLGIYQKSITQLQAQLMGCQFEDEAAMIDCLRDVPADKLVESGDNFKIFSIDPLNIYLPSIETKTKNNPEPFITKQPIEYIRNKEFSNIPWIVGFVQDEGRIRAEPIVRQSHTRQALNKDFGSLMPELLQLSVSTSNKSELWEEIRTFYFQEKNGIDIHDRSTIKGFTDVYTDRAFAYTTYQAALFHRLQGHENIWVYNFNYTGANSYGPIFAATEENVNYPWGAAHCDDLVYLFKTPALFKAQLSNPVDIAMKNLMTGLFSNFAEKGDPNPNTTSKLWKKITGENSNFTKDICYLDIEASRKEYATPHLQMKQGLHQERFHFWENIALVENIPELSQNHIDL